MRNYAKVLAAAAALSSIIGITALAATGPWSGKADMIDWTDSSSRVYKGAGSGNRATLSCDQIYDTSIILNFRSTNVTYTSSTATIMYPAKSAIATYSNYSSGDYHPVLMLAPTSRYSSVTLSGSFTP